MYHSPTHPTHPSLRSPDLCTLLDTDSDEEISIKEFFKFMGMESPTKAAGRASSPRMRSPRGGGVSSPSLSKYKALRPGVIGYTEDGEELVADWNISHKVDTLSAKGDPYSPRKSPIMRDAPLSGYEITVLKQKLRSEAYGTSGTEGSDFTALFARYDKDKSGTMSADELTAIIRRVGGKKGKLSDREGRYVIKMMDENADGEISLEEFVNFVKGEEHHSVYDDLMAAATMKETKKRQPVSSTISRTSARKKKVKRKPKWNPSVSPHSVSILSSPPLKKPNGKLSEEVSEWEIEQFKAKMRAASYTMGGQDWRKLFQHYDRDNSGSLSIAEFSRAVRSSNMTGRRIPDRAINGIVNLLDSDDDGLIDIDEVGSVGAVLVRERCAIHS